MRRTNGRGSNINGTRPNVTLGYGFRPIPRLSSVHVPVYSTSTIEGSARSWIDQRTVSSWYRVSKKRSKKSEKYRGENDLYKNPRIRFYGQLK